MNGFLHVKVVVNVYIVITVDIDIIIYIQISVIVKVNIAKDMFKNSWRCNRVNGIGG